MAIDFPSDHPIIGLRDQVSQATHPFLQRMGLNYFQFLRCFHDGSIGLLSNDTRLLEHVRHIPPSPAVFSSVQNKPSYWFMWHEELPKEPVDMVGNEYGVWQGLTLVKRTKSYYDMIAVALPTPVENVGSFYLNKIQAIESFFGEFDQKYRHLINIMHQNPLVLPKAYRDTNLAQMPLSEPNITVGSTHLTYQEWSCLLLLRQGQTYKSIAATLNISPRTVETYIQRAKNRTNTTTLGELEKLCP